MPWTELVSASLEVDAVVLAMHGPLVRRFCHDLFDAVELTGTLPPVTISGWVGVIIEKIIAGYLDRFATDVVAVNSRSELATFEAVARSLRSSDLQSRAQWAAAAFRRASERRPSIPRSRG